RLSRLLFSRSLARRLVSRPRFAVCLRAARAPSWAPWNRHYREGAPPGWQDNYVSSYATMHPAEDWAETFAHYLHMRDTLDTAAAYHFAPADAAFPHAAGFTTLIDEWIPLAWELNMLNRSMGHHDLYPFVLPEKVLEKMHFVHDTCARVGETG